MCVHVTHANPVSRLCVKTLTKFARTPNISTLWYQHLTIALSTTIVSLTIYTPCLVEDEQLEKLGGEALYYCSMPNWYPSSSR